MRWYIWWVDLGYHAMDTSQEVSSQAYIYILCVGYPLQASMPSTPLLQVLRTLHRMSYTIPQDTIALTSPPPRRDHHSASGSTTHLDHVPGPLDPRDLDI